MNTGTGTNGGTGSGTSTDLASEVRDNPNINFADYHSSGHIDNATALQNINDAANGLVVERSSYGNAPGGTTSLRDSLLSGMLALAENYTYFVQELAGGSHVPNSRHYVGVALDVGVIDGSPVNVDNQDFPGFMQTCRDLGATEVLGPGDRDHDTHIHSAWPRP